MIKGLIKPDEYFHLRDGRVLVDLKELLYALKGMDNHTFNHHITQDRNDFGNWVLHVFKENDLAEQIFRAKTKEEIIEALERRISPKLVQPEIEDHHNVPKKFDFREKMASQFETVRDAFEKQKEEVAREGFPIGYEVTKQPNSESRASRAAEDMHGSLEDVVDPDNDFRIRKEDEPDLRELVKEAKKKKGKPKKTDSKPQIQSEPSENGTDVSALSRASELVRSYPFERTTAREMKEQAEQNQKTQTEILEKEKEVVVKLDEVLIKERELELREQKILEIEERLEKELMNIANKKDPKFFSKEFIHGLLIGLLITLIAGLVYIKFWG